MKKKFILGIIITLIIAIFSVLVLKATGYFDDIKINEIKKDEAILEDTAMIKEISSKYFNKLNLESTNQDLNIEYYDNIIDSSKEIKVSNQQAILTLDAKDGKLISVINQKESFPKNNLTEDEIKINANKLLEQIKENDNEYELLYLEEVDDELWRAGFAKKYGDLYNVGEQIKFSFAPATNEILTLSIKSIKYANNEIKLTEEDATKIAKKYLEKSVANNMDMHIDIVMPNSFFANDVKSTDIMVKPKETRKAYVFKFDNKGETTLYVDCTTGEVLGATLLAGEKF